MRRNPKEEEALRARLKEAGLKVTEPRVAVLRALSKEGTPVSHAELATKLSAERLDKVTVWRVLVALTEAGVVDRNDVGDRTWRFELRKDGALGHDPHPHFMCVSCKTVKCLPADAVKIAPRIGREVIEVQIKGRCEDCR